MSNQKGLVDNACRSGGAMSTPVMTPAERELFALQHSLEKARSQTQTIIGLMHLSEELRSSRDDDPDTAKGMKWYTKYHSGSIQQAVFHLAESIDDSLDHVEKRVAEHLPAVTHE